MEFEKVSSYIQEVLKTQLSPLLQYHSYDHTMLVLKSAVEIASIELIHNKEDLIILKTAVLFHDCGFLKTYEKNTEEEACIVARKNLLNFNYSTNQIEIICNLIMKTKVPQSPSTLLEKILCDADMYYLGDDDYENISDGLFLELNSYGKNIGVKDWLEIQINFIASHHYWTNSCILNLEAKKQENLFRLKSVFSTLKQ